MRNALPGSSTQSVPIGRFQQNRASSQLVSGTAPRGPAATPGADRFDVSGPCMASGPASVYGAALRNLPDPYREFMIQSVIYRTQFCCGGRGNEPLLPHAVNHHFDADELQCLSAAGVKVYSFPSLTISLPIHS